MSSTVEFDLHGADPRSVDELKAALESCMHDWPGVAPRRVMCTKMDECVYGSTNNRRTNEFGPGDDVRVNEEAMSNLTAWQQALRTTTVMHESSMNEMAAGWIQQHPAAYTIEHEFGHVLFGHLYGEGGSPVGEHACAKFQTLAWRVSGVPEAQEDIPDILVPLGFVLGIGHNEIARDLSIYAATSPLELVAEAFAVERVLGRGYSRIADAVNDKLRMDFESQRRSSLGGDFNFDSN